MARNNFKLPETSMVVVVWYRNGKANETVIDKPVSNDALEQTMLMQHKVAASEIRAVKAVDTDELKRSMFRGLLAA